MTDEIKLVEELAETYRNKWIGDHEDMIADLHSTIRAALAFRTHPEVSEEMVERVSEVIYDFLDERFPKGAMPGGIQLFADAGDHLDARMKHEAGCDAMARAILAALNGAKP